MGSPDVAVVGGGIIGSAIAWRLAQAGVTVTVYDRDDVGMASTVAAGLLAPVTEAGFGETGLLDLLVAAARMWPSFAAELDEFTDVAYRRCGTLLVGIDAADQADIGRYEAFYRQLGLDARPLTADECQRAEPLLSPRVRAGLYASGDHQVNPRKVVTALAEAAAAAGVRRVTADVSDLAEIDAGRVVLAAGSWSGALARLPVRPVHGQVVRLLGRPRTPGLRQCVRAINRGRPVYIVPRVDGEVVIGASSREAGYDTAAIAGDTVTLLRDAIDVVPELAEYHLAETNVGLRPGTPDNAPLLGPIGQGRVVAATGHYRNGVLMAPITAGLITGYLLDGTVPAVMEPFSVDRFT